MLSGQATDMNSCLLIFLSQMSTVPSELWVCVLVLQFPFLALIKSREEDEVFLYI